MIIVRAPNWGGRRTRGRELAMSEASAIAVPATQRALTRFAFYLAIPLWTWMGSSMVDRAGRAARLTCGYSSLAPA